MALRLLILTQAVKVVPKFQAPDEQFRAQVQPSLPGAQDC